MRVAHPAQTASVGEPPKSCAAKRMQVFCRRPFGRTPALDQKEGFSWKRGTEVVDQIREASGAPASSRRISKARVVHPPMPDADEERPGGVMMRGAHAQTSGAPATKPCSTVSSPEPRSSRVPPAGAGVV